MVEYKVLSIRSYFRVKTIESGKITGKTWYSKHDIAYFTAVIDAKYKSKFEHTKDTPDHAKCNASYQTEAKNGTVRSMEDVSILLIFT